MPTLKTMRLILWVAAVFNLIAALTFAFPGALGQFIGLPAQVPPLYAALVALFVLLFSGSYAWLAMQPVIHRQLLCFGAIGKTMAFVAAFVFWIFGEISGLLFLMGCGDLVFAAIFANWLRRTA